MSFSLVALTLLAAAPGAAPGWTPTPVDWSAPARPVGDAWELLLGRPAATSWLIEVVR